MYKFTHVDNETGNSYVMTIEDDDVTWVNLVGSFQDFLSGCSYIFDKTKFDMAAILSEAHDEYTKAKYGKQERDNW